MVPAKTPRARSLTLLLDKKSMKNLLDKFKVMVPAPPPHHLSTEFFKQIDLQGFKALLYLCEMGRPTSIFEAKLQHLMTSRAACQLPAWVRVVPRWDNTQMSSPL